MIAGMARVEITFLVDADGLLQGHGEGADHRQGGLDRGEAELRPVRRGGRAHADRVVRARRGRPRGAQPASSSASRPSASSRRRARRSRPMPRCSTDDVRAAGEAAMAELEAAMAGDDYLADPRRDRGARHRDQAVRAAAHEPRGRRAAPRQTLDEAEGRVAARGCRSPRRARGRPLMPKLTFSIRTARSRPAR